MNETENENNGITIGEIFRIIGKKIWLAFGISVLAAVLAALVLGLWINPRHTEYTMEFVIVYPTQDTASYPDGTPFSYRELISSDFLNAAKDSDESFKNVDVARIVRTENSISIEAETEDRSGVKRETGRYELSIKGSYFTGREQVEKFLTALVNVPVERMKANAAEIEFATSSEIFDAAPFEEQLSMLAADKEAFLKRYDEWIETYTGEYKVTPVGGEGEKRAMSLKDFRATVSALYGESTQKDLENELESFGYYKGDLDAYAVRLRNEYWKNEGEITTLKEAAAGGGAGFDITVSSSEKDGANFVVSSDPTPAQRYAELVRRNNNIKTWLGGKYIGSSKEAAPDKAYTAKEGEASVYDDGTLNSANIDAFKARVNAERDNLVIAAETLKAVTLGIYEQGMSVRPEEHISASGGVGLAIGVVAVFVVVLLVACIAVFFTERHRRRTVVSAERTEEKEDPKDNEA